MDCDSEKYDDNSSFVRNHPRIKPLIDELLEMEPILERKDWFHKQQGWIYGLRNHDSLSLIPDWDSPISQSIPETFPSDSVYERNTLGWSVTDNVIDCLGSTKNYQASIVEIEAGLKKVIKLLKHGRFLGPFKSRESAQRFFGEEKIRVWPIFYKKEEGKHRLLVNLSFDKNGPSFNDQIAPEEKTVKYLMVRELVQWMVVCDIQWLWAVDAWMAYYSVPIKKHFTPSVGIQMCGLVFFFITLTMGMATAPKLYTQFADIITWIIINNYVSLFTMIVNDKPWDLLYHYVDDWIGGTPNDDIAFAHLQLSRTLWWKKTLGVPTQPKKVTFPAKAIDFIGYVFDVGVIKKCLRITSKRMRKYRLSLKSLIGKCKANVPIALGNLQSVNGQLRSLQIVYPQIVPWLRASEEIANVPSKVVNGKWIPATVWVMSNPTMLSDLIHVQKLLSIDSDNFMTFDWILCNKFNCDITIYTDASTGIGVGGYVHVNHGHYYHNVWTEFDVYRNFTKKPDIQFLELLGVVTAAKLFKNQLRNKKVLFFCDNLPAVWVCIKKSACFRRPDLTALVKELRTVAQEFNFKPYLEHVAGVSNVTADTLSRGSIPANRWIFPKSEKLRLNTSGSDARLIISDLLLRHQLLLDYAPLYSCKRLFEDRGFTIDCNCKDKEQCDAWNHRVGL